jgi:hypothetical protein
MNYFDEAENFGFSPDQILNFLSNAYPAFNKSISAAKKHGYAPTRIVNFLSNIFSDEVIPGGTETDQEMLSGEQAKQKVTDLATTGLTALGGYAIGKAAGSLLPKSFGNSGPKPMANAPVQPSTITQNATVPNQPSPSSQGVSPAVGGASSTPPSVSSAFNVLQEMGLEERINSMKEAGNSPENIGKALDQFISPGQKKWLSEQIKIGKAKPIPQMVEDYLSPKIAKNNVVATPEGVVGILKSQKQRDALIDSDGKVHKVLKEDLVSVPPEMQDSDFSSMADKYISQFPRSGPGSLSSNVALLSYDRANRQLIGTFVTSPGKMYIYENVPEDLYQTIKSQSVAPKTSGSAYSGDWDVTDADSIGSPMQEITRNPDKYPFTTHEIGYDMLAPFKEAISQREKEYAKKQREAKKKKGSS